ncbi:MAG TPA: hypothetical protein VKJ00_04410, partial [Thermoanaerobaculia bacterium]|nr:hypothetical protein [Thermoanaerobaculia bacterium]
NVAPKVVHFLVSSDAAAQQRAVAEPGDAGNVLGVDRRWPYRTPPPDMPPVVLPEIGAGALSAVDRAVIRAEGMTWTPKIAGAYLDVTRGGAHVGRFRIEEVLDEGRSLRLDAASLGAVAPGDGIEGVWVFDRVELIRGAQVVSADRIEAASMVVDSSSSLQAKNLAIPPPIDLLPACSSETKEASPGELPPAVRRPE